MNRAEPVAEGRLVDRVSKAGRVTVDVAQMKREGRVVSMRATATIGGQITVDEDVRIVNPPVLVPDPEGDIVRIVGEDEHGDPIERRYRHDTDAALAEVLALIAER